MKNLPEFFHLDRYNISPADVTRMVFHAPPEAVRSDVIMMPWWQPDIFEPWIDSITTVSENILFDLVYRGKSISVIRSGIGAPQTGDAVLALGCTNCQRVLFAGSIGGLRLEMSVGDLMLPECSYAGDGFSRYLEPGFPTNDCSCSRSCPTQP